MATGMSFKHQYTLINAPAGSGKTTAISKSIRELIDSSDKRLLCITYTNRAAEQLSIQIDDDHVDVSTIHSFISSFMSPIFEKEIIKQFYGEIFGPQIDDLLCNEDPNIKERIEKYRLRNEFDSDIQLTRNLVIKKLKKIQYGETQYSSFLYGLLSHDDLLVFAKEVITNYPKVRGMISQQYSHVFIDEYQDTKSDVLELFYRATKDTSTKLILLGDEMQQIYPDRVEEFEDIIEKEFYKDNSLKNNWRSTRYIVNVLNNLYFDPDYIQDSVYNRGEKPQISIVEDINSVTVEDGTLELVLYNSDLFDRINAGSLYRAYNERYKQFDKYSAKQILTDFSPDNPDDLMLLLIFVTYISELFDNERYGEIIKRVHRFKHSNTDFWAVNNHSDKVMIQGSLKVLSEMIKSEISLEELLEYLRSNKMINPQYIEEIIANIEQNEDFKERIYPIKFSEVLFCFKESMKQSISTQHAVKGEGHDAVALKITDGSNPNVQMYLFLELWCKNQFNYKELKRLVKDIKGIKAEYITLYGMPATSSKLTKDIYLEMQEQYSALISDLQKTIQSHHFIYEHIFSREITSYFDRPNVTNIKKCLSTLNKLEGIILAYKLFYVGCSRAKEMLHVYLIDEMIKSFDSELKEKMNSIGFEVVYESY